MMKEYIIFDKNKQMIVASIEARTRSKAENHIIEVLRQLRIPYSDLELLKVSKKFKTFTVQNNTLIQR